MATLQYFGEIPSTLKGSTLIVPSISCGWVSQAALDLIINAFVLERIGHFVDDAVPPVVCVKAETGEICTALELYHDPKEELTIFQIRSAPAEGHSMAFASRIMDWARSQGFAKCFLLSSGNINYRTPKQIESSEPRGKRFIALPTAPEEDVKRLSDLGWKQLEQYEEKKKLLDGTGNLWDLLHSASGFSEAQMISKMKAEMLKDMPEREKRMIAKAQRIAARKQQKARKSDGDDEDMGKMIGIGEEEDEEDDEDELFGTHFFPPPNSAFMSEVQQASSSTQPSASSSSPLAASSSSTSEEMAPEKPSLPLLILLTFASETNAHTLETAIYFADTLKDVFGWGKELKWEHLKEWAPTSMISSENELY
ncbi:putative proteasome assembly chaperone 2 [Monocercomonoides exilis]|uniref:putative proteasome assembly chaperone 2 n=1 Tax=Monocercomonoides exilis TaxID=2049356 RepID=UPI00355A0932|nr:putative proteasome assembly chaperone 2 [Monocercomonoides exilis]|eukprot:MONOS_14470.1-p1 / transcript=MONOS_14470.1 / gene=MONOS_14470 / organism=Monocercomonoides_exilis_PA203 / gene_product=unspecified product / transcript_product=unspecified product / location=Mono_scaffold01007:16216-17585(-) / protein_length=366 / sequence_SO=supercontig / SO=protein_coding / is_pseudo=false